MFGFALAYADIRFFTLLIDARPPATLLLFASLFQLVKEPFAFQPANTAILKPKTTTFLTLFAKTSLLLLFRFTLSSYSKILKALSNFR